MASEGANAANDPRAWRMAGFAFLTHNLMIGSVFGSYGVLIPAIEAQLHLSRDVSSLGIPLVMLVIALGAPLIGGLLGRVSLRRLMMAGAVLMIAGFALLATGSGVVPFLLAYALLLGPAMSLNSAMIPTTLVTRWFDAQRGRALGFVNMPLLAAFMPPLLALVLTRGGLSAAYGLMAAMGGLLLLVALFVIDYPPRTMPAAGESAHERTNHNASLDIGALLRSGRFWGVVAGFAVLAMSASVMSAHVVPLAMGWGDRGDARRHAAELQLDRRHDRLCRLGLDRRTAWWDPGARNPLPERRRALVTPDDASVLLSAVRHSGLYGIHHRPRRADL